MNRVLVVDSLKKHITEEKYAPIMEEGLYLHCFEYTKDIELDKKIGSQKYTFLLVEIFQNIDIFEDKLKEVEEKNKQEKINLLSTFPVSSLITEYFSEEASSKDFQNILKIDRTKLYYKKWEHITKKKKEENEYLYKPNEEAAVSDITCSKCKKNRIVYFEKQTRSCDEPKSIFYRCLNCPNKWVR